MSTLPAGTKETANRTAENTVANIFETPRLMAQPTSTCTDLGTETSSFLNWSDFAVEAETTAKSEDECANQSESSDEPMRPTARVRPTPSSSHSVRSHCGPNREASDRWWKFSAATRPSSRTMPSRDIRAKDHCHSSRARPAATGSTHEGKASRRVILLVRPAWTPTAPRSLQKQQTIERQRWCDDGSWQTVPRAFKGLPLRESLL